MSGGGQPLREGITSSRYSFIHSNSCKLMKTSLIPLLALGLFATSCNHKNDDLVAPAASAATVTFPQQLTAGTWIVTSYMQATEDKTSQLDGYRFAFAANGQATASHSSSTDPGSWTWGGNSYYGTPADSKTVVFTFGNQHPLDRISKSWIIVSVDDKLIKLDSSNPAEQEHLTLGR